MRLLITGATGKVGSNLIRRLRSEPHPDLVIRALCHNRALAPAPGLEVVRGTISDRGAVEGAMDGVTHVVHLATCKETPELVMDVTVKGLFWLTEAFRASPTAKQFILIGGDASVGHFFYDHGSPVTEATPHAAYPGCYALSKVLEELLLQQTHIQYGLNFSCLRAPWIMEKDDFRYSLSFGDDVFGGPDWKTLVAPEIAERCRKKGTIPLLRDAHGRPSSAISSMSTTSSTRFSPRSTIRRPKASSTTSRWTSQSTMPPSPPISRRRGAWARSTFRAPITPTGSTIRAPGSTSTGARNTTSQNSSTPRGLTSARPTIRGRCGIRGSAPRVELGAGGLLIAEQAQLFRKRTRAASDGPADVKC